MNSEDLIDPPGLDLAVDLQWACDSFKHSPTEHDIRQWASAAVVESASTQAANVEMGGEVTIRVVDSREMQSANAQWRGQDKPTNVLSFPADFPPETGLKYFGDILVCAEVVQAESVQQGKLPQAHWAHMVVHGMLHLQGFDHIEEDEAQEMEQREVAILHELGYPNPYAVDSKQEY